MQLILSILAALCLATVRGQNPCDRAAQTSFVLGLNGGLTCGLNFQAAEATPTTPEEEMALDNALNGICTAECAGAVASWFLGSPCSDTDVNSTLENYSAALFLQLWCQPADNAAISRCRFALDAIDVSVINNTDIESCAAFATMQVCLPTCTSGLQRLSSELGCCYQGIYNNSQVLGALSAMMSITQEQAMFFTLLGNSNLWAACGVDIIDECTSDPFPETPTTAADDDTTTASASTLTSTITVIAIGAILSVLF